MKYSKSTKTCMRVGDSDDRSIEQALNFQHRKPTKHTELAQTTLGPVTGDQTAHSQ